MAVPGEGVLVTLTAQDVFAAQVADLPKSERLKLAALILGDLQANAEVLDYSES